MVLYIARRFKHALAGPKSRRHPQGTVWRITLVINIPLVLSPKAYSPPSSWSTLESAVCEGLA